MPKYNVKDSDGTTLVIEGDSPPTEQELTQIFSKVKLNVVPSEYEKFKMDEAKSHNPETYSPGFTPANQNPDADFTRATHGDPILAIPLAIGAKLAGSKDPEAFPFKPLFKPHQFSEEDIKGMPSVSRGLASAWNALSSDVSGLTAPESLVQIVGGGASKGVQALFLTQMASHLPELSENVVNAKTPEERVTAWTHLVDAGAMAGLLAKGMKEGRGLSVEGEVQGPLATGEVLQTPKGAKPSLTPLTDEALKQTTSKTTTESNKEAAPVTAQPPTESSLSPQAVSNETTAPATTEAPVTSKGNVTSEVTPTDFERYQELIKSVKGKTLNEVQPIMAEIEAIKNRNGGKPPTATESQPVETPTTETPVSDNAPTPPAEPVSAEDATALKYKLIDQQRVARGEEPLPKPDTVGDKAVEDKANALVEKNPLLPEQLVEELNANPRPLNSEESIVVLKKLADVKNERNLANEEVNKLAEEKTKDPSKETDWMLAKIRSAQAEENLHKVETAARYAGSEQGRAFRLRQMLVNEDFTFASLESRRRAAKGGAPLTEPERVELSKVAEDYKKADEALQNHLQGQAPIHPQVLAMADRIIANLDKRAAAAKVRIREKLSRASSGVDPTLLIDALEVGVAHAARYGVDFARWSEKVIEDVGDWVKPHLKDLFDKSQAKLNGMKASDAVKRTISNPEERALKAFKTRTKNRINELETKMAEGDFSKTPKKTTVLDREAMDLQAQKERVVKRFQAEQEKIRLKNRTNWAKALDFMSDFKRFSVLTSAKVVPKLISAGIQRLTTMPLEELIGSAWRQVPGIKQVAAKAPLEGGGFNLGAEMKGFGAAFTKGMKDSYDVLKTGHSDLDVLYGKGNASYAGETSAGTVFLEIPGRIHGMIKAPVKRAAFERSAQILGEFYAKQGLDVTDPLVKTRIAVESYKAANRSIFLEDNRVVSAYKAGLSRLEGKDATIGSKAAATALKIALPIVRVPTNIAVETMRYSLGAIKAPIRITYALSKGMENLKPEEADAIMRDLKKGSIGAAVLLLGYYNADQIGGFYQPNKKQKQGDVKYGSVRIFGHDIPSYLLHNPLLETLQIGATIRKVADSKLRKKDTEVQGLASGTVAAALGVAEETPFGREIVDLGKVFDPYQRKKWAEQQLEDQFVPKIVQQGYQLGTNVLNHAP